MRHHHHHHPSLICLFLLLAVHTTNAFTIHHSSHHHLRPAAVTLSLPSSSSFTATTTSQINLSSSNKIENNDENNNDATFYSPNAKLKEEETEEETTDDDDSSSVSVSESNSNNEMGVNEYSFFDEATIFIRAGSGGQGASTYRKAPGGQNGQPDGGDGGKGGSVIILTEPSLNTLAGLTRAFRPNSYGGGGAAAITMSNRPMSFRAENGKDGMKSYKSGKYAKDVVIRVPCGTVVQEEVDIWEVDEETGENKVVGMELVDMGTVGKEEWDKEMIVGIGGEGGEGSGNQGYKKGRGVRRTRAPPVGGERKRLKLTLKIVADVALVGVPNAGKSTFLAAVTRAKPKIANYPFTTVIPNLGVWIPPNDYSDEGDHMNSGSGSEGLALCDVPGLIAGAAEGVGLGHAFLRHVERCHVILHLVDATSNDPVADFKMVNSEIMRYGNGKLAQMPQIVVVNKVDAWEEGSGEVWELGLKTRMDRETLEMELKEAMPHSRLMWMSAKEREGVDDLMGRMSGFVKKVKESGSL
jgi:GTP-binding protein